MKKRLSALFALALFCTGAIAADQNLANHLEVRVTPEGVLSMVKNAINLAVGLDGKFSIVRPEAKYSGSRGFDLDQEKFKSILELTKSLFGIDLTQKTPYEVTLGAMTFNGLYKSEQFVLNMTPFTMDLTLGKNKKEKIHVETAPFKGEASLPLKKIKAKIISATSSKILIGLTAEFTNVKFLTNAIRVCDASGCNSKNTNRVELLRTGLKSAAQSLPIRINAKIAFNIVNGNGKFALESVKTNLVGQNAALIEMPLGDTILPPMSIEIDGKIIPINNAALKDMIYRSRQDIANAIVARIAAIISGDLVNGLNGMMDKLIVPTAKGTHTDFEEELKESLIPKPIDQDNLNPAYYRPAYVNIQSYAYELKNEPSPLEEAMSRAKRTIFDSSFSLEMNKSYLDAANILNFGFGGHFRLNNTSLVIGTKTGHGSLSSTLKTLAYTTAPSAESYDFSLAISEPLINSVLDLANSQLVLNSLADQGPGMSFTREGAKVHFRNVDGHPRVYAILNMAIDISKLDKWFYERWIGQAAEYIHGGTGILVLPIEFQFEPMVVNTKGHAIKLKLISGPFTMKTHANGKHFKAIANTFGYTYRYAKSAIVESSTLDGVDEATKDFNKDLMINIDELFAGLPLGAYPTKIGVESSGHLVIYGKVSK